MPHACLTSVCLINKPTWNCLPFHNYDDAQLNTFEFHKGRKNGGRSERKTHLPHLSFHTAKPIYSHHAYVLRVELPIKMPNIFESLFSKLELTLKITVEKWMTPRLIIRPERHVWRENRGWFKREGTYWRVWGWNWNLTVCWFNEVQGPGSCADHHDLWQPAAVHTLPRHNHPPYKYSTVHAGCLGNRMRDEHRRWLGTEEGFCTTLAENICSAPILRALAQSTACGDVRNG
jgi:hypothetical protein